MATSDGWRVNPVVEFHWRTWDDESVVLEARSGQIFRLDALGAALMACLEDAPATEEQLVATLAADLGTEPDPPLRESVAAMLAAFRQFGWIEPIISR